MALPEDQLHVGVPGHVVAQVLVGQEDHPVGAQGLDHLDGVGRGAADVGLRLDVGRGVDVGDHRHTRVALLEQPHVGAGDRVGQRAPGLQARNQHGLARREDLGGLRHEVDAGEDDHVGVGLRRHARQGEGVAGQVGDAVEDLRGLVVVAQDDGVLLRLEPVDRLDVRSVDGPLELGNDAPDPLVDLGRGAGDLRRVFESIGSADGLDGAHVDRLRVMLKLSIIGVKKKAGLASPLLSSSRRNKSKVENNRLSTPRHGPVTGG